GPSRRLRFTTARNGRSTRFRVRFRDGEALLDGDLSPLAGGEEDAPAQGRRVRARECPASQPASAYAARRILRWHGPGTEDRRAPGPRVTPDRARRRRTLA